MTQTTRLPVIVGFGGYNPAGRSSFHHAYRRLVINSIPDELRKSTLTGLAIMMKLVTFENGQYFDQQGQHIAADQIEDRFGADIFNGTLLRRIEPSYFDVDEVSSNRDVDLKAARETSFIMRRSNMPSQIPANWIVSDLSEKEVEIHVEGDFAVKIESFRKLAVQVAGQLPSGFEPAELYNSRFHPRGLQMAILGASDALNSVGIPWNEIVNSVAPDEISIYATSAMGQNDEMGNAGMLQARLRSSRVSSKQLPLGLNSMPADFINAYVCGNVGTTGSIAGACASFLYNLRLGVDDIKSGKRRVSIVGAAEAPILPEIIEGYHAMSALASNDRLSKLDGNGEIDYQRACRPFAENCGFSLGESTQYFVMMDDELAIELGAEVYGSVNDVFINADGFKKSISSPGAGNYITLSKAVAAAKAIVGEESIQQRSFVQAHGSGTPQNRITESHILDKVAKAFGIEDWPITAVKCYLGHPLAPASGDQLSTTLGVFTDNVIPAIGSITEVAEDVFDEQLDILIHDKTDVTIDVGFLNSKGFGGNNATASVLSQKITKAMLSKRHGEKTMSAYAKRLEKTQANAAEYDRAASNGDFKIIYNFGENIVDEQQIEISNDKLSLPGFENQIDLKLENPFGDMTD